MTDVSDLRKRVRQTIDRVRREAAERRRETAEAAGQFEAFLRKTVLPVFRTFQQILAVEGCPFELTTPPGQVRLVSVRSPEDFIEIAFDTDRTPLAVMGRWKYTLGRRVSERERPIAEGRQIAELTETDVEQFLLAAIEPFVER
jgi:hypothetical protein